RSAPGREVADPELRLARFRARPNRRAERRHRARPALPVRLRLRVLRRSRRGLEPELLRQFRPPRAARRDQAWDSAVGGGRDQRQRQGQRQGQGQGQGQGQRQRQRQRQRQGQLQRQRQGQRQRRERDRERGRG